MCNTDTIGKEEYYEKAYLGNASGDDDDRIAGVLCC